MKIEFDQREYIEQMQITGQINKLQEEKEKLEETNKKIKGEINNSIEYVIKLSEKELSQLKEKLKKVNIFSRISRKKRKEIEEIKKNIKYREGLIETTNKKIADYNEKIDKIQRQIDEIQRQIDGLKKNKIEMSISSPIKTDGTLITITDESSIPVKEDAKDDYVMVHCTDFFPADRKILCNYDGKKTAEAVVTYNGVSKKCQSLSHRHSCHFTLNNVVRSTGDGAGSWDQPKFVVIDLLDNNRDKFVSVATSDSWTYGSVTLSERPILLVREDVYEEIPVDQLHNYNIIKYSGNYETCVKNAIKLFGYKTYKTDANYAGHANSPEYKVELNLNGRNLCLNYIFDNMYNGKDNISISDEEMINFFKVLKQKKGHKDLYIDVFYDEISKLSGVPIDFVKLAVDSGITKDNDNFSFKSDDKMYYETIKLDDHLKDKVTAEECREVVLENIDIKELQEIYKVYTTCSSKKHNDTEKSNENNSTNNEVNDLEISELYKFSNHDKALSVIQRIKQIIKEKNNISIVTEPSISIDGIEISLYISSNFFDKKKLEENGYEVRESGFSNDSNFILLINIKQQKVKDILQELDDFLENLYFYSKSKSSFEQAKSEFELLTEQERKKMTEEGLEIEETQQEVSHIR